MDSKHPLSSSLRTRIAPENGRRRDQIQGAVNPREQEGHRCTGQGTLERPVERRAGEWQRLPDPVIRRVSGRSIAVAVPQIANNGRVIAGRCHPLPRGDDGI